MSRASKIVCGLVILLCLFAFPFAQVSAQNQSGSIQIGGTVPGPSPEQAPIIETPTPNFNTKDRQLDVLGTCQSGLVVKVFRNAIFAGSALCQADGSFELIIDLTEGRNDLVARQYDLLNQPSPDSEKVPVFYTDETTVPSQTDTAKFQLVIDYDYHFQGIFAGDGFRLPVHFIGGSGPYAVSVNWGDGNSNIASREETGEFFMEHTYEAAGPQSVKIQVSDADGQDAAIQFALIVSGQPSSATAIASESEENQVQWQMVMWSSLVMGTFSFTAGFVVATFWDSMRTKLRGQKIKK